MNAVFTIVAKNYLSQARALGDSIKKHHPDLDFFIFLADEMEGCINIDNEKHKIIEFKDIEVPFYRDMAFKYYVLEFCTAIKPFCLEYLFNAYQYEKIIYLDPDIYVYSSLDCIFDELNKNFVVLTPHFIHQELKYSGAFSEEELLFVGIYNLGFVAFNNSEKGRFVIKWWQNKLKDKCYADRIDALHVDQKWMDFLPSFYDQGVLNFKHLGCNIALWNLHERKLLLIDEKYVVEDTHTGKIMPLVFFHFSGFDPNQAHFMCRKQKKYNLDNRPDFKNIFEQYAKELFNNSFTELKKATYAYSKFSNGIQITQFQRRLYRLVTDEQHQNYISFDKNKYDFSNPFSVANNSFYAVLKQQDLLVMENDEKFDSIGKNTYKNLSKQVTILTFLMKILKKILGTKRYFLLMIFLIKYSRTENQDFLLKS